MRRDTVSFSGRACALLAALGILLTFFMLVVRPWHLTWGSTPAERLAPLAGDEHLVATAQSTRAIAIDAPANRVWPWVAQLGQDRAGFYSFEILQDLAGGEMPRVDDLRPALQHWELGDELWFFPPRTLSANGYALLWHLHPGEALTFAARQFGTPSTQPRDLTWSIILRRPDREHTRLLLRTRQAGDRSLGLELFDRLLFEPAHFVMERRMLEGVKKHVEGRPPSFAFEGLEVGIFAACLALFLIACARLLLDRRALAMIWMVVALGLAFQLLTFMQPPWWIGAPLLTLLTVGTLGRSFMSRRQPPPTPVPVESGPAGVVGA